VEPQELAIERLEVRLPRLPLALDGLTIAQLSDIHFGPFLGEPHLRRIVDATNGLLADLVVLTGDFVSMPVGYDQRKRLRATEEAGPCARVLAGLHSRLGVFAVLGNHDHGYNPNIVTRYFEASSIPVLQNRSTPIEAKGARLWLAGVDDVLENAADLRRTLQDVPKDEPTVVLVHEPDFADQIAAAPYPVDLQLSGHSHGGQVRLPLLGAPVLPDLARKYPWGLRRVGDLQLYTNRGVGTIVLPVRLNCPPEITLLTLRSGA
jgi:predicted MPP superfamily phosphohydrolase